MVKRKNKFSLFLFCMREGERLTKYALLNSTHDPNEILSFCRKRFPSRPAYCMPPLDDRRCNRVSTVKLLSRISIDSCNFAYMVILTSVGNPLSSSWFSTSFLNSTEFRPRDGDISIINILRRILFLCFLRSRSFLSW